MEIMMMAQMLRLSRVHELIGHAGPMAVIELGVDAMMSYGASLRDAIAPLRYVRAN